MTLFTIKADTGSIVAEELSRDDLRMAEAQGLIQGDWLARESGSESWIKVREVLKGETLGDSAAPKGKAAIDPEDEALELKSPKGLTSNLTLKVLQDGYNAGDSEISTGFVRLRRHAGQPAGPWMQVEAFLAEYGNRAAGRSSGPTLPPPLLIRPEQRDSTQATTQQVGGGLEIWAELPTIGRCLRWKERKWFEPQMQFTLKGKAGLISKFEATFMDLFQRGGHLGVEIFRAKESPDTASRIDRRILNVSETLAGFKNAGALSEVTLETVGQDLQVSVFTYTFKRVFRREFAIFTLLVLAFVGLCKGTGGLIGFVVFVFALVGLTQGHYQRLNKYRANHQRERASLSQAVESCIQQTVSVGSLGITANDVYSPPTARTPGL